MTVPEILAMAREQANVESTDFSDADLLKYVNLAYHDLENSITTDVDEYFFYDIWTTDLVTGQTEYIMEESSSTEIGFKKIVQVEMKFTNDDLYYTKVPFRSLQLKDHSRDYMADKTSTSDAFYDIKDSSLWVYPKPAHDITNGLKASTVSNMIDLTATDIETLVFPDHTELRQRHYVIAFGIVPYIMGWRGQPNDKINTMNEYEMHKKKMLEQLKGRLDSFQDTVLPNRNRFQY